MGWPEGGRQTKERPEDLGRGHTMPPERLHLWGCHHGASRSSENSSGEDWGKLERCQGPGISWPGCRGHAGQALMESTRQTHVGLPLAAPDPAEGPLWRPLLLCFCEGREQDPWGSLPTAARRKGSEEGAPREGSAERAPRLELTRRAGSTSQIRSRLQQAIS